MGSYRLGSMMAAAGAGAPVAAAAAAAASAAAAAAAAVAATASAAAAAVTVGLTSLLRRISEVQMMSSCAQSGEARILMSPG